MAIEANGAALLLKLRRDGVDLGRVLTLSHQHLHLDPATHRRVLARLGLPLADEVPMQARVELGTSVPVFLLVHARRDSVRDVFATVPQQSDYVVDWASDKPAARPKQVEAWKESPILRPIRRICRQMLLRRHRRIFSFRNRAFYEPADLRI